MSFRRPDHGWKMHGNPTHVILGALPIRADGRTRTLTEMPAKQTNSGATTGPVTDTREPRPGGEVVVYEASGGEVSISVRLEQETVWLTERQMADVFQTTRQNVNRHLQVVFLDGELDRAATSKDFLLVRTEGRRRVRRAVAAPRLP